MVVRDAGRSRLHGMHLWPPSAPGNRVVTAALVLAVHALAALVMLSGREDRDRRPAAPRELEGVWITLHLADLREQLPEPAEAQAPPSPSPSPPRGQALVRPQPRTAITLPPPVDTGPVPQDDSSTTPADPAPAGPIDWYGQARELAKDYTGDEPATFSPPPKVMRACKPRESSFWGKPAEPKEETPQWDRATRPPPGSVMMGGTRVGVIPLVGISIPLGGPKQEPDKHLFDDMMAGKTPESSVPSPHVCD